MNAHTSRIFAALSLLMFPAMCLAQPSYSIDFQGPTAGAGFVNEGDILTPVGPGIVPPPAVVIPVGAAGLGVLPTAVGLSEVDALSYGTDLFLRQNPATFVRWEFSVDEFALGIPGVPFPSVTTEGAAGALEASADVYFSLTPAGPIAPGPFGGNAGVWDGNGGATPFAALGLNLVEPNPPGPALPDPGDNLDAWDANSVPGFPVYFSLDSAFPDPLEGAVPPNSGTAGANGFVGGDVLITGAPGGPPAPYALAGVLGLDVVAPPGSDDLDALVLWENGIPGYQPTLGPYSWLAGTDMLLYSVRRGSAVIGAPDAIFGAPIEPGDILVPVFGGGGGFFPGIMIPAELLGLVTARSFPGALGDDLDALDLVPEPGTLSLLAMGGLALIAVKRRRAA